MQRPGVYSEAGLRSLSGQRNPGAWETCYATENPRVTCIKSR